jgi:hypothetical protein
MMVCCDPFARGGLRRFTVANTARRYTCDWCGQTPARLYAYAWEPYSGREAAEPSRSFCNLGCYHAYSD